MKYTILVNQSGVVNYNLETKTDFIDWALLDYIFAFQQNPEGLFHENKIWINYAHLIKEMPLLGLNAKNSVANRIKKIRELGLVDTYQSPVNQKIYARTTKLYYDVTQFKGSPDTTSKKFSPVPTQEHPVPTQEHPVPQEEHILDNHISSNHLSFPREDALEVQNPAVGVEITTNISAEIPSPVEQFADVQSPVQTVQEPKAKSDNKSWSWIEFNFAFALSYLISKNRVDATARIDGINMTLWHEWMQSRKANKAKMTENALTTCLQDLIEINNAGLDANIAMQEAIKRDWLGLGHWIQKMKPKGNFAQSAGKFSTGASERVTEWKIPDEWKTDESVVNANAIDSTATVMPENQFLRWGA